jgi:hypothetical protein
MPQCTVALLRYPQGPTIFAASLGPTRDKVNFSNHIKELEPAT